MSRRPPKLAQYFVQWFCDDTWKDEVLGDLEEQFLDNMEKSLWLARLIYWWEAFRFLRPHILRKTQKLNHTMMTINHIKISYRNLARNKVYAFINIIGLSVGIASMILIGLYVHFETSYDQFFSNSERIYRVALHRVYPTRTKDFGTSSINLAPVLKRDYPQVEEATRLHRLFFQNEIPVQIEGRDKAFIEKRFLFADSLFFRVFEHPFIHGNPATALDGESSVVITRSTALKYFGTDAALNRTINLSGQTAEITGVIEDIPDNSHIHFDLLGTITGLGFLDQAIATNNWTNPWVYSYVKLHEGADPDALEAQFDDMVAKNGNAELSSSLGADWQEAGHAFEYYMQPVSSIHLESQLDVEVEPNGSLAFVYVLTAIAFFILIISSINFINLSIARSTERAKEVGIRKVLGSFRSILIGQFLTESVFICFLSSILALGVLYLFIPNFNQLVGTHLHYSTLIHPVAIGGILAFILLTGVLSGLYPAISISSLLPSRVLKGSFKSSSKGVWLRNALIMVQFLISIVMISGSVVAFQQMDFLQNKNLGFDQDNVLVVKQAFNLAENYQSFQNELASIPGVMEIGAATLLPGSFHGSGVFKCTNPEIPDVRANTCSADDNYFNAMDFELIEGRFFEERFDDSLSVVVNEAFLIAMGIEEANNHKLYSATADGSRGPERTIIGVVKDYNFYSLHSEVGPMIVFNTSPGVSLSNVVVRVNSTNTTEVIRSIERLWQEMSQENFNYSFLDQDLQQQYESDNNTAKMFNIFTYIAIIMSCTGLFALATYVVNQRSKEMGIRKVLGASLPHIIAVFSKEFIILISVAFVIGIPIAFYALNEWLSSFAYHVSVGVLSFAIAGVLTAMLVLITVSYQALKIATINPVKVLRSE
ncbi:MAG: ABC transporter permease [Cytophagales bacterium]|nr:ABC transporter permease [Cytophagales bacterium]